MRQCLGRDIGDAALEDRLILMQCVSAYPTPVEEATSRASILADRYGITTGYSNREGLDACLAAALVRSYRGSFTDQ